MGVKAIRHGDLCLVQVNSLPKDLQLAKPDDTDVLMQGSGGNNHSVKNGLVYLKDVGRFIFGYLVSQPKCQLLHLDHGSGKGPIKSAAIPEGIYELRRQFEHTHDSMKQVLD